MKPSEIRTYLTTLVPANEPVLLVGSPGVGKTATVEQVAEELKYDLVVSHPVVDDPTDYKGMPSVIRHEKGDATAEFLPFGDLNKLINAKKDTIAFADDLGQAPPAVQAAYMQLVLARQINGHKISPKVRFLAATNRRQDKAAVTGLITPLLDRFTTVITFDFDLEDWIGWALNAGMPAALIAFARYRPDLLNKFEANRDMKKSSTPRSVAGIGRMLKAGIDNFEVFAGAAGEGFATEFLAFYRTYLDLPDLQTIYMNPDKAPVPAQKKRGVPYALMGAQAHNMAPANMEASVKYLERCPAEFSVLCMKDALGRNPKLKQQNAMHKGAHAHKDVFGYV